MHFCNCICFCLIFDRILFHNISCENNTYCYEQHNIETYLIGKDRYSSSARLPRYQIHSHYSRLLYPPYPDSAHTVTVADVVVHVSYEQHLRPDIYTHTNLTEAITLLCLHRHDPCTHKNMLQYCV